MEKQRPHYDLKVIVAQMNTVENLNFTQSALNDLRLAGMTRADAFEVVQNLSRTNFYKSMTTYKNHQVWQDVYHVEWRGKTLYLKFQQAGEFFIVSFKER